MSLPGSPNYDWGDFTLQQYNKISINEQLIEICLYTNANTAIGLAKLLIIIFDYIDSDEIPRFLFSLKRHIFTVCSEDTIFIFHM